MYREMRLEMRSGRVRSRAARVNQCQNQRFGPRKDLGNDLFERRHRAAGGLDEPGKRCSCGSGSGSADVLGFRGEGTTF